jgi:hypothetical protein
MERLIPYLLYKIVFFGLQNSIVPLKRSGNFLFLLALNIIILQSVRNECVRFGGHVDIEVNYKILVLDVLKKIPSLQNSPCFE